MRPTYRPSVEGLESLTLLSGLAPGLTETLTTDRPSYPVGTPVHMRLTEANTSRQDVSFWAGPSTDGFTVTQNGATVWRSNGGYLPQYIQRITLHPGESYTLQATWDGHPNDEQGIESPATPTGTFQVHNQLEGRSDTDQPARITIEAAPTPRPAPPPRSVSVTTDRASYRPGQPVTITLTETNTTGHDVPAVFGCQILSASATGPGGPVWRYRDMRLCPTIVGVLHAGESRRFTLVWDGRPHAPGARLVPGVYTIRAGVDGVSGTAVVRIGVR